MVLKEEREREREIDRDEEGERKRCSVGGDDDGGGGGGGGNGATAVLLVWPIPAKRMVGMQSMAAEVTQTDRQGLAEDRGKIVVPPPRPLHLVS